MSFSLVGLVGLVISVTNDPEFDNIGLVSWCRRPDMYMVSGMIDDGIRAYAYRQWEEEQRSLEIEYVTVRKHCNFTHSTFPSYHIKKSTELPTGIWAAYVHSVS